MKTRYLTLGFASLMSATTLFSCVVVNSETPNTSSTHYSYSYSKSQARHTISQTAYVVNQAYEISSFYSYWTDSRISKAVYYNDYAQSLYHRGKYRLAINYSLLAREYALDVMDGCDDYWEYFYYTHFGWSNRYGYNPNFAYSNGYRDGYYDGYYAAYCARHNHDYRKDPYRNLNSQWYSNERYAQVTNSSMRNQSHGNSGNNNGSMGRNSNTGFRNINRSDYYSTEENSMTETLPSENEMETGFKRDNPNIVLSGESVKNDASVITRSRENIKNSTATMRNTQLQKPVRITTTNNNATSSDNDNHKQNNTRNPISNKEPQNINNFDIQRTNTNQRNINTTIDKERIQDTKTESKTTDLAPIRRNNIQNSTPNQRTTTTTSTRTDSQKNTTPTRKTNNNALNNTNQRNTPINVERKTTTNTRTTTTRKSNTTPSTQKSTSTSTKRTTNNSPTNTRGRR